MANNQTVEKAFNELLSQILGKNFFDNVLIKKFDSKSKIKKSIQLIREEYAYGLSLQAECVPDAKRIIIQAKRKLDGLEALLTISELL